MNEFKFKKVNPTIKRDEEGKFTNKDKKRTFKSIIIKSLVILSVIVGATGYGAYRVDKFYDEYDNQSPVIFKIRSPFKKQDKPTYSSLVKESIAAIVTPPKPRYKNEIDQYIYEKFGKDGDLAVQIARAENGAQDCDLIIIEPNDTVSMGAFMINSVHFKRFPPKDLVDCKKNADAAFQIYSEQGGFQAWSVYKNGNYKKVDLRNYLND